MATAKKSTTSSASANNNNPAAAATEAAAKTARDAQKAADKVVSMSTDAVQQFWKHGTQEAQKTREKVMALGQESAQTWTRSADTFSKNLSEMMNIARGNVEAVVECGNIASEVARDITTDAYNFSNKTFADNVEASKQVFSCRTANDFFELSNQLFRNNVDAFFGQSAKLTEKAFKYSQEAAEPIQERLNETTTKINKAFAA